MNRNKVLSALLCFILVSIAFVGLAKQVKVLRIYSGGEIIQEHKISDIDYVEIQDIEEGNDEVGFIAGHEYVDLGLPSGLKWATCNVGASSPEEYGDYFAWGETEPKDEYTEENCKTWELNLSDISGNPEYDAARANWGGTWRMPSQSEMQELIEKCTWTWTTKNGINGYIVTGPNKNQIFLPATGIRNGSSHNGVGSYGLYWLYTSNNSQGAYELYFNSSSRGMGSDDRNCGQSVRPVTE